MIYLILLSILLCGICLIQRLEMVSLKYRMKIIEDNVEKMVKQVEREHNGMVCYDLMLKRLNEIKQHIKHG